MASRSISSQAIRGRGGRPAAARRSSIGGQAGSSPGRAAEPEALAGRLALGDRREPLAGDREAVGQVRGEDAGIAQPLPRRIAGQAVEVDARAGPHRTAPGPGPAASRSRPARTSPVPPLASAGFSNGAMATSPSGVAMTVRAPFRTTHLAPARRGIADGGHARVVVAARSPSASGSRPLPARSRANSPACGREHRRAAVAVPPVVHRGERPERLGVEQDRRRVRLVGDDEAPDQLGGGEAGPQARAR